MCGLFTFRVLYDCDIYVRALRLGLRENDKVIPCLGVLIWVSPCRSAGFSRPSLQMTSTPPSTWLLPLPPHGFYTFHHMASTPPTTWLLPSVTWLLPSVTWLLLHHESRFIISTPPSLGFCPSHHMASTPPITWLLLLPPHAF